MTNMYYRLNDDKTCTVCDQDQWIKQQFSMEKQNSRHVADELIDQKRVSTVFLGLNHNFEFPDKPQIFETMVFDPPDSGCDIYCDRYATWDDALAGHAKAVQWVKDGCKKKIDAENRSADVKKYK